MKCQVKFTIYPAEHHSWRIEECLEQIALAFIDEVNFDFMIVHSMDYRVDSHGFIKNGNIFGFVSRFMGNPTRLIKRILRAFDVAGIKITERSISVYNVHMSEPEVKALKEFCNKRNVLIDYNEEEEIPF